MTDLIDLTGNCDEDLHLHVINDEALNLEFEDIKTHADANLMLDNLLQIFEVTSEQEQYFLNEAEEQILTFEKVLESFINGQFKQFIEQAEEYEEENYFLEELEQTQQVTEKQKVKMLMHLLRHSNYWS